MKKFENFSKALDNLALIERYEQPFDKVVLTGLVGLYEICFEQAWKAMKEILEEHGFSEAVTGSPKQVLKTAYKAGMIYDEELWLEALLSRNNVAHSYNEGIALSIVNNAKEKYLDMFKKLKEELAANWVQN